MNNVFNKLNLMQKFILVFGFLLFLVLCLILIAVYQIISTNKSYNQLVEKDLQAYNQLYYLYAQGLQSEQALRNIILNPQDNIAKQNYIKSINNFNNSLGYLDVYFKGAYQYEQITNLKNKWNDLNVMKKEIIDLSVKGAFNDARELLMKKSTPVWREVKDLILELEKNQKNKIVAAKEDFLSFINNNIYVITIFGSLTFVVSIWFVFYILRIIIKPIKNLNKAVKNIIKGNYDVNIQHNCNDEIGQLTKNFNEMTDTITIQLQYLSAIPLPVMVIDKDFNIQYINEAGAKFLGKNQFDLIGTKCYRNFNTQDCNSDKCASLRCMRSLVTTTSETNSLIRDRQIPVSYTAYPIKNRNGKVIGSIEVFTDLSNSKEKENYLSTSVRKILSAMELFSSGDLTVELKVENKDHYIDELFLGFNKSVKKFRDLLYELISSIETTASAVNEISSSSEQLSSGTQEQSAQVIEISDAISQITESFIETTKLANESSEVAKQADITSSDGGKAIEAAIQEMIKISEIVKKSGEVAKELGKDSEQIGEIVKVIQDIADQTNLLALNAAIEAARAGEHGRGFSVVADEVRKLAEKTTKATKEIDHMIKSIQSETKKAVHSVEQGNKEVEVGINMVKKAGESINKIISSITTAAQLTKSVAEANQEQSKVIKQVSYNIQEISQVINETSDGIQQIALSTNDINKLITNLQNMVSQFVIYNNRFIRN